MKFWLCARVMHTIYFTNSWQELEVLLQPKCSPMSLELTFSPASLVRWLDRDERRRRVLLLDLDIDTTEKDGVVRFDFDLVFSPKSVRRGAVKQADYYVGSTSTLR